MADPNEYGYKENPYGQEEPVNVGFFIDRAWRFCWPNVIARAWHYQESRPDNAKNIEDGFKIDIPDSDDRWYMDLLSKDPFRTKTALEAEGIIFMADANATAEDWDKWIFTRIVARTSNQSVNLTIKSNTSDSVGGYLDDKEDGYVRTNPWKNSHGIGHFLVLTVPPKPENPRYFAKALSDYKATNKVYPLA
jgi:hypothetical protein